MEGRIFVIRCTGWKEKYILQWTHSPQSVMDGVQWCTVSYGNIIHWFHVGVSEQHYASVCFWWMMAGVTQAGRRHTLEVFSFLFFADVHLCWLVLCCVICRVSLAVLPEWRLVPGGETRAFLHVSWTSPSPWKKHIYTLCPAHKHAHTKINTMAVLHTPPSTRYRSLWGLKHGNPISLVFFFPWKRHAPWSMWEFAYPPQLNHGGSAFIETPEQCFLRISDRFSWSIFKHGPRWF